MEQHTLKNVNTCWNIKYDVLFYVGFLTGTNATFYHRKHREPGGLPLAQPRPIQPPPLAQLPALKSSPSLGPEVHPHPRPKVIKHFTSVRMLALSLSQPCLSSLGVEPTLECPGQAQVLLEYLPLADLSSLVKCLWVRPGH